MRDVAQPTLIPDSKDGAESSAGGGMYCSLSAPVISSSPPSNASLTIIAVPIVPLRETTILHHVIICLYQLLQNWLLATTPAAINSDCTNVKVCCQSRHCFLFGAPDKLSRRLGQVPKVQIIMTRTLIGHRDSGGEDFRLDSGSNGTCSGSLQQ